MKKILATTIFTLLLTISSFAQAVEFGKITTKYDKFKDITSLSLKLAISKDTNEFFVLFINAAFDGKTPASSDKDIMFSFISMTSEKQPAPASRSWIALADDERINLGNGEYTNTLISTTYASTMAYFVSEINLKKIANAKKVEMQVGSKEFALSESQIASLKELYKQLVP